MDGLLCPNADVRRSSSMMTAPANVKAADLWLILSNSVIDGK